MKWEQYKNPKQLETGTISLMNHGEVTSVLKLVMPWLLAHYCHSFNKIIAYVLKINARLQGKNGSALKYCSAILLYT